MPKYEYTLSDEKGLRTKGVLSAASKEIASQKLRGKNKIIISITEKKSDRTWLIFRPKLSFQEKMTFVKSLSTMIKVGIPVTEALKIIAGQSERKGIKEMYKDIIDRLKSGQSLAKSLRKYDYTFSELFINMIETGEQSGNMDEVLDYLDLQLEKEYDLRKKITSAFIYPAVISGITILLAIGIVIFIMPKIIKIFRSFDMDLPAPTRALIAMSNFFSETPLLAAGTIIGTIAFFIILSRFKFIKELMHRLTLHIPVFGKILIEANVARFSRALNSLLQSGVPITEALKITGKMLDNSQYKKALLRAGEKVEQGGELGKSLGINKKLFPPLCTKMIEIGEKSGSMETTTDSIAKLYEKNVDSKTKNLSVLLEPLLLVFMGVIVGGMALSIIMPIYQLPNLMSK